MIDAHLHVVEVGTVRAAAHLAPSGPWWEHADPSIDAVLERVAGAGVDRAVLVQAVGAHGYDCSYLVSAQRPAVALVGAVDPFGPDPVAALDALALAGVAGLRLFSIRPSEPWLDAEVGHALVARCVELGVRPSVCILPAEIPALLSLAAAFPDTEFALDHVAFARSDAELSALRAAENLCPTVTATSGLSIDRALDHFGVDRLSWGSDHPQHTPTYPAAVELPAAERLWFAN
ncbi:MAG: amidohydrolase family protein [Actinomycetota bacterium]